MLSSSLILFDNFCFHIEELSGIETDYVMGYGVKRISLLAFQALIREMSIRSTSDGRARMIDSLPCEREISVIEIVLWICSSAPFTGGPFRFSNGIFIAHYADVLWELPRPSETFYQLFYSVIHTISRISCRSLIDYVVGIFPLLRGQLLSDLVSVTSVCHFQLLFQIKHNMQLHKKLNKRKY